MSHPVKVHGLSAGEVAALRETALRLYGKPSVSLLAKKLLQQQLETPQEPPLHKLPKPSDYKRITVRLPEKDRAYLLAVSRQQHCSVNDVVRTIIQSHIRHYPFLTGNETDALYQSNYQLLRIGRNINQLAKQFNRGEGGSISSRQIHELADFIGRHTDKVAHVLAVNRKRTPR